MSFGDQSNAWQRNMMQGHPWSISSRQESPQMFMPQHSNIAAFGQVDEKGDGGMDSKSGVDRFLYYAQNRSGLDPVAFQSSGDAGCSNLPQTNYNSFGTVTKINNDCGLVNDEVFFFRNVCEGREPELGDRVIFEASCSNSGQFKWNATRIHIMQTPPQTMMNSVKSNYSSIDPSNDYQWAQMAQRHISQRNDSPVRVDAVEGNVRYERERHDRKSERERHHHSRDREESIYSGQFEWNAKRIHMQTAPKTMMNSVKSNYSSIDPSNDFQWTQVAQRPISPRRDSPLRGAAVEGNVRHERERHDRESERELHHYSRDREESNYRSVASPYDYQRKQMTRRPISPKRISTLRGNPVEGNVIHERERHDRERHHHSRERQESNYRSLAPHKDYFRTQMTTKRVSPLRGAAVGGIVKHGRERLEREDERKRCHQFRDMEEDEHVRKRHNDDHVRSSDHNHTMSTSRTITPSVSSRTKLIKPMNDERKPSFVQRDSSKPDTPKVSQVLAEYNPVETPDSGAGKLVQIQSSTKPVTPKVSQDLPEYNPVETPDSGAGKLVQIQSTTKPVSSMPNILLGEHAKKDSDIPKAFPMASMASNSVPPKHKTPSKRAFTTRRSAYRKINLLGSKPVDELTEQEKSSLQWAKTYLESIKRIPPPTEDGSPKRLPSDIEPKRLPSDVEPKRLPSDVKPKLQPSDIELKSLSSDEQRGSSKQDNPKASQVLTGCNPAKTPASGAGKLVQIQSTTKPVSSMPNILQGEHAKKDLLLSKASPSTSTTSNSTRSKHKTPSRKAFITKRSAYRIVTRLGSKPVDELTEQEKSSLQWAEKHIESIKSIPPPTEDSNPIRLPLDVKPKQLPSDVEPKRLPSNEEPKRLQSDVKPKRLPSIVDPKSLPSDIEPKRLPFDREPKRLPSDVKPKRLQSNVQRKRLPSHVEPKRHRSEEGTLPATKRFRNMPAPSQQKLHKKVTKKQLTWAIIDRNNSDGTISSANWKLVVLALTGEFIRFIRKNPGPPPQCEDAGWYQGHIKLIACADERSAQLYKAAIESLGEVWPGARLEAVPLAKVPKRPRSYAKIPALPSDAAEILRTIQISNPQLPTKNWKVVKVTDVANGYRWATVIINSDSLTLLRKTQGKISYAFGTILLRLHKGDVKKSLQTPEKGYQIKCKENKTACSPSNEDIQSIAQLGKMEAVVDEDDHLKTDDELEDADITVIHSDDLL